MADKIITPECVLSYPNLFEARAYKAGDAPKYSATLVFTKDTDISALKRAALETLTETWGAKVEDMLRKKQLRLPFRDGAEKDYPDGSIFVNVSSVQRPGVVDQRVQPILDPSDIYPGCVVRASVRPFTYDTKGNKGVSFGLNNLQKLRDGERLDNRTRPDQDFDAVAVDDAIPFDALSTDVKSLEDLLS